MEEFSASRVDAYLRRIGAERPGSASAAALRDLHLRHLRTVAFESLSIHLGQEIVLEGRHCSTSCCTAAAAGSVTS